MNIKLKHHYLNNPAGTIVSGYGDGVCAELIRRGIAEEVKGAVKADTKMIESPPRNKMVEKPGRMK